MARTALTLDAAIQRIHLDSVKAATRPGGDEIAIDIPDGSWTQAERRTLESMRDHYVSCALAYRDNPKPFGVYRTDLSAWHRWVQAGLLTGEHRYRIDALSHRDRDLLQTCKVAGHAVVAPHVLASDDPTPRHLRPDTLMRRFEANAPTAYALRELLTTLDAGPQVTAHYSEIAKRDGLAVAFFELHRWADHVRQLEPDDEDALHCMTERYYDDSFDRPSLDDPEDPDSLAAAYECDGGDPDAEPLPVETSDEATELLEPPDMIGYEDANLAGGFETIGYHAVAQGDLEPDPLEHDPWIDKIQRAKPQEVAQIGKALYEHQKQDGHDGKVRWGYRWAYWKARRQNCPQTPGYTTMLQAITVAESWPRMAELGKHAFADSKRWLSHERKHFWAEYHRRKADLQPSQHAG